MKNLTMNLGSVHYNTDKYIVCIINVINAVTKNPIDTL